MENNGTYRWSPDNNQGKPKMNFKKHSKKIVIGAVLVALLIVASGCFYTVDFTAEYNGKDYSGTMTVLTVLFEGKEYVISVELDRMEDAFYQDNFPAGDYYYDMFGEY